MESEERTKSQQLVGNILDGDNKAFQQFVEQYQRLVIHIVCRMITNHADREDLCQDIFIKVYRNLGTFRFECKISSWIGRIAYTTCINYMQKSKAQLYDDVSAEHVTLEDFAGNEILPDSAITEADIASRMAAEISTLNFRYRTILTLFHLDEMSYEEIGQIMDLPEGTVKSYLFRARKQLKEKLLSKYRKEEICHSHT